MDHFGAHAHGHGLLFSVSIITGHQCIQWFHDLCIPVYEFFIMIHEPKKAKKSLTVHDCGQSNMAVTFFGSVLSLPWTQCDTGMLFVNERIQNLKALISIPLPTTFQNYPSIFECDLQGL